MVDFVVFYPSVQGQELLFDLMASISRQHYALCVHRQVCLFSQHSDSDLFYARFRDDRCETMTVKQADCASTSVPLLLSEAMFVLGVFGAYSHPFPASLCSSWGQLWGWLSLLQRANRLNALLIGRDKVGNIVSSLKTIEKFLTS